jgi:hypothetical protein
VPDASQEAPRKLLAKVFLTIDTITVWFPLGLQGEETEIEASGLDLRPEGLVEDSMFEAMPGTFSHHAIKDANDLLAITQLDGVPSLERIGRRRRQFLQTSP